MALYQNPEFQEDWRKLFFRTKKKNKNKKTKGVPLSFFGGVKILSFPDLLETLDSDRGPWDIDLSAKIEALDPSRAEILRSRVAFMPL